MPPGPPGPHIKFKKYRKVKNSKIRFLDFGPHFRIFYEVPEAREVFKNLPGARGFVVIEYEPVASHGDPIRAQNDGECDKSRCIGEQ